MEQLKRLGKELTVGINGRHRARFALARRYCKDYRSFGPHLYCMKDFMTKPGIFYCSIDRCPYIEEGRNENHRRVDSQVS